MDHSFIVSRPWFRDPRLLIGAAAGAAAVAIALVGAAMGVASARTDSSAIKTQAASGALSIEMRPPKEIAPVSSSGKLATLDPAALREQAATVSSDPEGDENLRVIDAQERRLQAMNDREAAAFAAQMRQIERSDLAMAGEVRKIDEEEPAQRPGLSTSNTTGPD